MGEAWYRHLRVCSDEREPDSGETVHGRVHFPGIPSKGDYAERGGQYSYAGDLELGNHSVTRERTFDEQGRPLEWKFFEDSVLSSVSQYRYEGDECVLTERDASGKVIEVTKQKPFSVTVQGKPRAAHTIARLVACFGTGLVASFKK